MKFDLNIVYTTPIKMALKSGKWDIVKCFLKHKKDDFLSQ